MKRVLFKRYLRDIKKNFFRYAALLILIAVCMFLVVAIVDSAYSLIEGTKDLQKEAKLEDCQVTLFNPFTDDEIRKIEEKGVTVESHRSFDYTLEDGSVLRIFENREKIDLVVYDEGREAKTSGEIVLLNRYCAENEIGVGDKIRVDGTDFTVVGIGSSVDYDAPYRKLSDTSIDSSIFGTAFVCAEDYNRLKNDEGAATEDVTYAFLLNGAMTSDELKQMIKDFDFDYNQVDDPYYKEMLADSYGKRDEITDGINNLVDGVDELYDGTVELFDGVGELKDGTEDFKEGLKELADGSEDLLDGVKEFKDGAEELDKGVGELKDGSGKLKDGAISLKDGSASLKTGLNTLKDGATSLKTGADTLNQNSAAINQGAGSIFDGLVKNTQDSINRSITGINASMQTNLPLLSLNRNNYAEELTKFAAMLESFGMDATDVYNAKASLDGVSQYVSGVEGYTAGVGSIASGAGELSNGEASAASGAASLENGAISLANGAKDLDDGVGKVKEATGKMKNGAKDLYDGTEELNDAIKEAYDASGELDDGAGEMMDGAGELKDGVKELKDGVKDLKEQSDEMMDKIFSEAPDNITAFMTSAENNRVGGAAGDVVIDKTVGLYAGVIVIVLLTYVLSVFVIHQIQSESSVIGALYALGARKSDLILHYIFIPTMVALIGGTAGGLAGMSKFGCKWQMADCYNYFSIPDMPAIAPLYLVFYSVLMPAAVAAIVNFLVINKSLSRTALSLLRNEQKISGGKDIKLGKMSFVSKYRIRQILRESRTAVTVIFGMAISLLVFMLGMDCYVLCESVGRLNSEDTTYNYMYTYKYPTKEVPEGGEACFIKTLKREQYGYNLDITVIGIDDDNPYYKAKPVKGKNKVVASDAVVQRYHVKKGEKIVFTDNAEDIDYAFTIEDVVPYSVGITVFMDIDSMRELFGEEDDYYNVVLSDEKLDIEEGRLYSVTSKADIDKASKIFLKLMMPMSTMLIGMSIVIFCIVMYLMMSVMIDRATQGISLLKILGYRSGEVKKLYLDGNRVVIMIGALIGVPVSKLLIDMLFPTFIANVACSMHLEFTWYMYLCIFGAIMILYEIINFILMKKLGRISENEVLKNRE
ncbi:putative ABC transport system permease protein [Lachnospiraceae bacterium G41]|nr:putative ABC transport system permease protein [Lachnospiraceae bacterium G41]